VTSAVKFEPVTENVCAVEAVPAVVVNALKVGVAGLRVIVGEEPLPAVLITILSRNARLAVVAMTIVEFAWPPENVSVLRS
jgi:hypothetical protein